MGLLDKAMPNLEKELTAFRETLGTIGAAILELLDEVKRTNSLLVTLVTQGGQPSFVPYVVPAGPYPNTFPAPPYPGYPTITCES